MAYRRGDFAPALACWKNTKDTDEMKLTSACLGITAAMSKGDYETFDEILQFAGECMKQADNPFDKALLSLPEVLAAVCFVVPDMVPEWLKKEDFSLFPAEIVPFLLYLHSMHLRNIGDFKGVQITTKTQLILSTRKNTFSWLDLNNSLLCAWACLKLNDREQTKQYLLQAINLGLPYGIIMPFADYVGLFGGLLEALVEEYYPQYKDSILALWGKSFPNWITFHNHFARKNITTILSSQEYQVAYLIANGSSYAEASRNMFLSVSRIKRILSGIYKRLDIQNRYQLGDFILYRQN